MDRLRLSPDEIQVDASVTTSFATGWLFKINQIFDKINID